GMASRRSPSVRAAALATTSASRGPARQSIERRPGRGPQCHTGRATTWDAARCQRNEQSWREWSRSLLLGGEILAHRSSRGSGYGQAKPSALADLSWPREPGRAGESNFFGPCVL